MLRKLFIIVTLLSFGCSSNESTPLEPTETPLAEWRGAALVVFPQEGVSGVSFSRSGHRDFQAGYAHRAQKTEDGYLVPIEQEGNTHGITKPLYLDTHGASDSFEQELASFLEADYQNGIIEVPVKSFFKP